MIKRRTARKPTTKSLKSKTQTKAGSPFKHVVIFKVKSGPYQSKQIADQYRAKASHIQGAGCTPVTKVGNGYGFTIVMRYGARNAQDKAKIVSSIKACHKSSGAPGSKVSITSKAV